MDPKVDVVSSKRKSSRIVTFFLIVLVPVASIVIAVYSAEHDLDFSDMLLKGFKKGDLLGAKDSVVEGNTDFSSVFEKNIRPIFAKPIHVTISTVGISLNLIPLGVDESGKMLTPEDWNLSGWYMYSGKPGEGKNIVINGHYDDNKGQPAAFFNLSKVKKDEMIEIKDNFGRIFTYKVVESDYVDIDDPERLQVLKDHEGRETLTLITCGGVWLPEFGYNKRLVVLGELTTSEEM